MESNDQDRRRAELQDEFLSSPEYALLQRLQAFDLSLEIFRRNYRSLKECIDSHLPSDIAGIATFTQDHQARNEQQIEITRKLHNFVASASSLIDHTRVFYREIYESANTIPEYQQEIDARFKSHELSQFVKCLRQYAQHFRLPLISSQLSINSETQSIDLSVVLPKSMLLSFSGWSSAAKRYIDGQGAEIELSKIADDYCSHVEQFHQWFVNKQRIVHASELRYIEDVRTKMKELS